MRNASEHFVSSRYSDKKRFKFFRHPNIRNIKFLKRLDCRRSIFTNCNRNRFKLTCISINFFDIKTFTAECRDKNARIFGMVEAKGFLETPPKHPSLPARRVKRKQTCLFSFPSHKGRRLRLNEVRDFRS